MFLMMGVDMERSFFATDREGCTWQFSTKYGNIDQSGLDFEICSSAVSLKTIEDNIGRGFSGYMDVLKNIGSTKPPTSSAAA